MTARSLSFAGWPSGMDNIHADHELDASFRTVEAPHNATQE